MVGSRSVKSPDHQSSQVTAQLRMVNEGAHGTITQSMLFCRHGRRRPAQLLRPATRHGGAPLHRPRHPRALERYDLVAGVGHRLCHALSRSVPRGGRALSRLDAGNAGRGALAVVAAGAGRAGRGGRLAADRCGGRSRAAGACAGKFGRPGRAAARSVAGARRRRPTAGGGAQPARAVGAHGHDAVRSGPALFAAADHAPPARDLVHADRMGRGALRAADRARLVPALGRGLGTRRRNDLGAVCRRAYRRGDEAGLSRDPGAARAAPPGADAATGARPLAGRCRAIPS